MARYEWRYKWSRDHKDPNGNVGCFHSDYEGWYYSHRVLYKTHKGAIDSVKRTYGYSAKKYKERYGKMWKRYWSRDINWLLSEITVTKIRVKVED